MNRGSGVPMTKTKRYLALAALIVVALALWQLVRMSLSAISPDLGARVDAIWTQALFDIGGVRFTIASIFKIAIYLAVIVFLTNQITRLFTTHILDNTTLDEGKKFSFQRGISIFMISLGVLMGLHFIGLDLTSFALFTGAIGIGIGLGFQNIAKNFASGLVLLIESSVKVGDRIEIEGLQGDIVYIGSRGTWVRTNENVVIIVPNTEFIEGRVTNWTANDRKVRLNIPLGVSYDSDPERVREVLFEVAKNHPDVLEDPASDVIFTGFGESSLDFELRIWTTKQVTTPRIIASDIYFKVFAAFKREGIEIPFPQRDLHLRSSSVPLTGDHSSQWRSGTEPRGPEPNESELRN